MTVWIEAAFAENCFMDGVLLYLSLKCARVRVSALRLVLAALLGGGEALLFPLLPLPAPLLYLVKFSGGLLLAFVAAKGLKNSFVAAGVFFALTFCLGGAIVAVYSFFGAEPAGEGYRIGRAPAGFVLTAAILFLFLAGRAAKAFYRRRARERDLLSCALTVGDKTVRLTGLLDSGNRLSFRGKPVCVVSAVGALALFGGAPPVGRIRVSTVNGCRVSPVFVCDRLQLGEFPPRERVYFTVGEVSSPDYSLILHNSFPEGS